MNEILMYLKENGFIITENSLIEADDELTHIYTEKDDNYFLIVSPHSGNDFCYMLRVNDKETFDRWSIADVELFFKKPEKLINHLKKKY